MKNTKLDNWSEGVSENISIIQSFLHWSYWKTLIRPEAGCRMENKIKISLLTNNVVWLHFRTAGLEKGVSFNTFFRIFQNVAVY